MEMADKAVSTEDLCADPVPHNTYLEVARLEAVLNTLVENKVEAIKNEIKAPSLHSSPKALINRLRMTSTSTASSKEKDDHSGSHHSRHSRGTNRKHQRRKRSEEREKRHLKRAGRSKQRVSSSSPDSTKFSVARCCDERTTPPLLSDEDDAAAQETLGFLKYDCRPVVDICATTHPHHLQQQHPAIEPCCCRNDRNGQIKMNYDEDYVSLKIDEYDDVEEDAILAEEALKRAKRKRRRRRRKKARRKVAMTAIPIEEHVKVIDPDELPQRARWTIVATACLLLFMCLLLVGVTLRMAPIIDDMVRKENEELINSLNRENAVHGNQNVTTPVPV